MRRSYLDYIASEPAAPGGNPETNLLEWEELRMLAPNRVYRMAPVQELLLGIVTKRDCLGNTVDVFAAQTT